MPEILVHEELTLSELNHLINSHKLKPFLNEVPHLPIEGALVPSHFFSSTNKPDVE